MFPFSAMNSGTHEQPNMKYRTKLSEHNFLIGWGSWYGMRVYVLQF